MSLLLTRYRYIAIARRIYCYIMLTRLQQVVQKDISTLHAHNPSSLESVTMIALHVPYENRFILRAVVGSVPIATPP